jgi:hypothetical protein
VSDILSAICSESFYEAYTGDKLRFGGRRYDTVVAWEAARRGNLREAGNREIGVILEGFLENLAAPLVFSTTNWAVDSYHYPVITAEGVARAGYAWDDNAYRMVGTIAANGCIQQNIPYLLLDGIQMHNQSTNNAYNCTVYHVTPGYTGWGRIKNCWLKGGGRSGIYLFTSGGLEVDQCVVLDSCGSNSDYGGITIQGQLAKINNSVVISNSARGIYNRTPNEVIVNNTYVHVKNNNLGCFARNSTGGFILNGCASSDGTADDFYGSGNLVNIPYSTDNFEDIATPDLRHKTTGSLHQAGLNLTNPKSFDVSSVIPFTAEVTTGCVLELTNNSTEAIIKYYLFGSGSQTEYESLRTTITLPIAFSGATHKIGIISDIHYGYPGSDTVLPYARDGLNTLGCGTVLVLGDCANGATYYSALMTAVAVNNSMTWHFLAGNHDIYDANAPDNQGFEYYTGDNREYYIDIGNCRIYMLGVAGTDGTDNRYQTHADAVTLLDTDLSALRNNIICTHVPMPATIRDSRDYERYKYLRNYNDINKALAGKSVAALFSGHMHSGSFIPEPDAYCISSEADELSTDIEGVSRGSDWSIGLFEFVDEGGTYVTVTDSGSGADAIGQIAVALGVSDAGSAVDALPGARAVLGVADAGAGADMVSYLHNLLSAITDTGHGTESLGVSAGLAVQDSGVGTDSAGVAVSILVTDTGSGVDAVTLIADVIKRVTDVGSGIDAIGGITVQAGVSDAGQGADTAGVRVSLTVTDLGSAVDLVSTLQAALVTIADAGHGADTVGPVSVSLAVADSCQGIDVIGAVQALLRVLDAGAGVDIASSFEPSARIRTITATITAPGMTITVTAPGIKTTIT